MKSWQNQQGVETGFDKFLTPLIFISKQADLIKVLKEVFITLAALRKTTMDRNDFEEKQLRHQGRLRSYYDFGMGILWSIAGIFFLGYRKLGIDFDFDPLLTSIFGGACILYGVFRIWRGYKTKQQAG